MNIVSLLSQKSSTDLYENQGITYLGLFGSSARGEAKKNSDVDILIDFNQTKSLFEMANISLYFKKLLDQKVDLVDKKSLKKALIPYINQDLITIYEKN